MESPESDRDWNKILEDGPKVTDMAFVKVKRKVFLVYTMKAYWGSIGIAPLIHNLYTR